MEGNAELAREIGVVGDEGSRPRPPFSLILSHVLLAHLEHGLHCERAHAAAMAPIAHVEDDTPTCAFPSPEPFKRRASGLIYCASSRADHEAFRRKLPAARSVRYRQEVDQNARGPSASCWAVAGTWSIHCMGLGSVSGAASDRPGGAGEAAAAAAATPAGTKASQLTRRFT